MPKTLKMRTKNTEDPSHAGQIAKEVREEDKTVKVHLTQAKAPKTLEKRTSAKDLPHTGQSAKNIKDKDQRQKSISRRLKCQRR